MLFVFTGSDTARAKKEARKLGKEGAVVVFGEGGEPFERAPEYLGIQGLFAPKATLIIDRPFETSEGKALLKEHANALHESDADVFIIAPSLSAADKKLIPKGAELKMFDISNRQHSVPRPNVFAFTDAVLKGDRKDAWIGYRRLIMSGVAPEEIHGALSWAVRSALIAAKTKNATEAGLKPFVFGKSQRFASALGVERVEVLSRALVAAYHEARSGHGTMALNLEYLLLSN
ncbi:MAG: hypothetical protein ACE5F4_00550 [Candidatus Paceibacteria bacterium]